MSKITLDNLSDNLKEYLNGLGLTEEQVLELINQNGLNEEELKQMLESTMSINSLITNNKTIVGAINELFQDVDNGKNLIATSIGNPLVDGNSSFKAMSEAILGLRRNSENEVDAKKVLYDMMIEDGYTEATDEMTVDELIELLDDSQIELGDIKQIACGGNQHVMIIKKDGSLWACGSNNKGQLGLGTTTSHYKSFTQVTTNINNDVKQVICGGEHTFIIKTDGTVWACGNNSYGQLGLSGDKTTFTQVTTNVRNVKQIVCGYYHTMMLKNDGSLWACGYNLYGELGLNSATNTYSSFTQVTANVDNDVKEVGCGLFYSYIVKNDGTLYSCGYNNVGQLGMGYTDTNANRSFVRVTNEVDKVFCAIRHIMIIKTDGSVWACGENMYGKLGLGGTTNRTTFTQVNTNINNDVKQVACVGDHTFIIKNDNSLWACGFNGSGQLGIGSETSSVTTFTQVTTNINNDVEQIACGLDHTVLLKNDGSIWACGDNTSGQLGFGDSDDRNVFTKLYTIGSSVEITDYELNRLKLYYYLLDNEIEVTEDMDIGTMLNMLVNGIINNMINQYINNLKIVLSDEGVDVTEEDDMDSLITKVDEEFDRKNANSGLDIISATELPATGKENQICVITDNINATYIATIDATIESNGSNILYLEKTGTNIPITMNNITYNYPIKYVLSNSICLDSYYWRNGSWNVLSKTFYPVIIDGVQPADAIFELPASESYYGYEAYGSYFMSEDDVNFYRITAYKYNYTTSVVSSKTIDFSLYKKVEIIFKNSRYLAGYSDIHIMSTDSVEPGTVTLSLESDDPWDSGYIIECATYRVGKVGIHTAVFDITNWTGEHLFALLKDGCELCDVDYIDIYSIKFFK